MSEVESLVSVEEDDDRMRTTLSMPSLFTTEDRRSPCIGVFRLFSSLCSSASLEAAVCL